MIGVDSALNIYFLAQRWLHHGLNNEVHDNCRHQSMPLHALLLIHRAKSLPFAPRNQTVFVSVWIIAALLAIILVTDQGDMSSGNFRYHILLHDRTKHEKNALQLYYY